MHEKTFHHGIKKIVEILHEWNTGNVKLERCFVPKKLEGDAAYDGSFAAKRGFENS